MIISNLSIKKFVNFKNKKIVFTPGPGSLLEENILGLAPYFGRGDKDYLRIEKKVLNYLKKICGLDNIVTFQGSGSLAIEIALQNFIQGKILVVNTGYYSERLKIILNFLKQNFGKIKKIETVSWEKIKFIKKKYDWICACPVETSVGLKIPIKELYSLKKKSKSKLMLDATGSIGLESGHKYADVATFSSCKGLFGLTGAAFISYKTKPLKNIKSFYMNINTHIKKKLTGPYHTIGSLYYVLKNHSIIKKTVIKNKLKFIKDNKEFLIYSKKNQPNLCTYLKINIKKNNKNVILYTSRKKTKGSVVSHLGETYLKSSSKGEIQKYLIK